MTEPAAPPLAVLRIPKIRLEVPILRGTDDFTLNRAVGHIDDTALPLWRAGARAMFEIEAVFFDEKRGRVAYVS